MLAQAFAGQDHIDRAGLLLERPEIDAVAFEIAGDRLAQYPAGLRVERRLDAATSRC